MKENLNDLAAFVAVAQARSFTRAAAQLGVSRSALSHSMRGLEERLGIQLLTRTTRSVSTTEAGAHLLAIVAPRIGEIQLGLDELNGLREKPAGTVRITANDHCIQSILWPRLLPVLREYPDVRIEFDMDYGLTDIAAQGHDAGVRLGDTVDKDMIAVRIAADMRMGIAASPAYLEGKPLVHTPRDLTDHSCINLRLPTYGGIYAWEFEKEGQAISVRVQGQATFNNTLLMLRAAVDGMGIIYAPVELFTPHIEKGRLVPILEDWWPLFPGYHLYYTSRRQLSPVLTLVINALRFPQVERLP